MVAAMAEGMMGDFPGGGIYLMDVALNGVGLAEKHDADIDDAFFAVADEVAELMIRRSQHRRRSGFGRSGWTWT